MTLVYRAIWSDDLLNPVVALEDEFLQWCKTKNISAADIPYRGSFDVTDSVSVEVRRADSEAGAALRCVLRERDPQMRTWTTTATALSDTDVRTFWVDLDLDDPSGGRPEMAAPRLVRQLLELGTNPRLFGVPFRTTATIPSPRGAAELAAQILDPAREVPIVVFSPKRDEHPRIVIDRANRAAEVLAGVAHIFGVSEDGADALNAKLPHGFAVYGGAVRLYLPGIDAENPDDANRHRWIRWELISQHPRRAASMLAGQLARLQIHQPIPEVWTRLEPLLRRPDEQAVAARVHDLELQRINLGESGPVTYQIEIDGLTRRLAEAYLMAESYLEEARDTKGKLAAQIADAEEREWGTADELDLLVKQRDSLRRTVRELSRPPSTVEPGDVDPHTLDTPETCGDAVALALKHLTNLVIPADALVDVEELDDSPSYSVWASNLWQGLLALHDFAVEKRDNSATSGLKMWCDAHPDSWPPNKLAMTESDTVLQDKRLRQRRVLPVSADIDPSRRILMPAHLKIATRGASNIPRVYFHDDVAGPTGKIHIGFIGPHRHMPNTKS